jgi:hypothetical protein
MESEIFSGNESRTSLDDGLLSIEKQIGYVRFMPNIEGKEEYSQIMLSYIKEKLAPLQREKQSLEYRLANFNISKIKLAIGSAIWSFPLIGAAATAIFGYAQGSDCALSAAAGLVIGATATVATTVLFDEFEVYETVESALRSRLSEKINAVKLKIHEQYEKARQELTL